MSKAHTDLTRVYEAKLGDPARLPTKPNRQTDQPQVSKAHNDLIRVYEAKLGEFGIPAEELGFRPLVTNTSAGEPFGRVCA